MVLIETGSVLVLTRCKTYQMCIIPRELMNSREDGLKQAKMVLIETGNAKSCKSLTKV